MIKIYTANRMETDRAVFVNGIRLDPTPSQKIRDHSPDGFEWGYGGSGPSQLALAIMLDYLQDVDQAQMLYQQFKWDFVAPAPTEGFVITSMDIDRWMQDKK